MRKKEIAYNEIKQEFSNLLNNDIHDWYKNKDKLYYNVNTSSFLYKSTIDTIEKYNYKMHKNLIKRKIYRKYELDCKKIDDDLKRYTLSLEGGFNDYYNFFDEMAEISDYNKVYKKIIEFNNLIYEDNRNIDSSKRYLERWYNRINENKPEIKKEKIVYDKSKILGLKNKIKEGIDEHIFLNKNLDILEKTDENLEIYKKIKKEIHPRIRKCLSKLEDNIRDLVEMKSLIKKRFNKRLDEN